MKLTRALLRCGLAAGPTFVAAFVVEGAVRDGYRPLRHPVSSLALGPRGWIQNANFAVTGTLFLAAAVALSRSDDRATARPPVPALIAAAGTGLIAAAIFPTDPVSGYPPAEPAQTEPAQTEPAQTEPAQTEPSQIKPTRTGTAHNLAAVPVFLGLPAAALVCGWRSWRTGQRPFALYNAGTAAAMLATATLAGAGFGQSPRLVSLGGLFQRVSIITGFGWLTALTARELRRTGHAA